MNCRWFRFQAVQIWSSISVWFKIQWWNQIVDGDFDPISIFFWLNRSLSVYFWLKDQKKLIKRLKESIKRWKESIKRSKESIKRWKESIKRLKKSMYIKKVEIYRLFWSFSIQIRYLSIKMDFFDTVRTQLNWFRRHDYFGFQEFGLKIWLKSNLIMN